MNSDFIVSSLQAIDWSIESIPIISELGFIISPMKVAAITYIIQFQLTLKKKTDVTNI